MIIQVLSDLHCEVSGSETIDKINIREDVDVVVLAGDITTANKTYHLTHLINKITEKSDAEIVYIIGNHENYGGSFNTTTMKFEGNMMDHIDKLRNEHSNFHYLDNSHVYIKDVLFIGTTLWSDLKSRAELNPLIKYMVSQHVNDFYKIKDFEVDNLIELNRIAKGYLHKTLNETTDSKKVIVSHFVPSQKSIHPRYINHGLSPYFLCSIEKIITQVDLCIHGHTHTVSDYMIGDTRVVANPHGYPNEHSGYSVQKIVEV